MGSGWENLTIQLALKGLKGITLGIRPNGGFTVLLHPRLVSHLTKSDIIKYQQRSY